MRTSFWRAAYWLLLLVFLATAALNMLDFRAGFLTNHAADLFLPAWLYVVMRHYPGQRNPVNPLTRWLGRSPELAAGSLFIASSLTELSHRAAGKHRHPGCDSQSGLHRGGSGA